MMRLTTIEGDELQVDTRDIVDIETADPHVGDHAVLTLDDGSHRTVRESVAEVVRRILDEHYDIVDGRLVRSD